MPAMTLPPPVEWRTDEHPRGGVLNDPADDLGTELHHTATDDGRGPTGAADNPGELADLMRSIWRYHVVDRGWADVFYGYVVARDGSFAVGRGIDRGTSNGHRWLTIALAGNYDDVTATPAQLRTVAQLRAAAIYAAGIGDQLRGHGDRDTTRCPGSGGRWLLAQLAAGYQPDQQGDVTVTSANGATVIINPMQEVDSAYKEAGRKPGADPNGRAYWRWAIAAEAAVGGIGDALHVVNWMRAGDLENKMLGLPRIEL